jgi:hypothetical protein
MVKVAGVDYELEYPSLTVAATRNDRPTTPKANLIVTHSP